MTFQPTESPSEDSRFRFKPWQSSEITWFDIWCFQQNGRMKDSQGKIYGPNYAPGSPKFEMLLDMVNGTFNVREWVTKYDRDVSSKRIRQIAEKMVRLVMHRARQCSCKYHRWKRETGSVASQTECFERYITRRNK